MKEKNICKERALIDEYFDGLINDYNKEYMFSHIEKCESCNKYFTETKASIKIFNEVSIEPNIEVDPNAILNIISQREHRTNFIDSLFLKIEAMFLQIIETIKVRRVGFAISLACLLLVSLATFLIVDYNKGKQELREIAKKITNEKEKTSKRSVIKKARKVQTVDVEISKNKLKLSRNDHVNIDEDSPEAKANDTEKSEISIKL